MKESELLDLITRKIDSLIPDLNQEFANKASSSVATLRRGGDFASSNVISQVNQACIQGIKDRAQTIIEVIKEIVISLNFYVTHQLGANLKRIIEKYLPEDLHDFKMYKNFNLIPISSNSLFESALVNARSRALQGAFVEIDLFIYKEIRKNLISNEIKICEELFSILSVMVETYRKVPEGKPTYFLFHRVYTGKPNELISIGSNLKFEVNINDLNQLASAELINIIENGRSPKIYINQKGFDYYDEVKSMSADYVDPPNIQTKYEVVVLALNDARELIKTSGPTSAVDRVHTALHGYLIEKCKEINIITEPEEQLTSIFKKLRTNHPSLVNDPLYKDEISKVTNPFASVIDTLNTFRNKFSPSHPNENLLPEPEAMLMINAIRTILTYFESKLNIQ